MEAILKEYTEYLQSFIDTYAGMVKKPPKADKSNTVVRLRRLTEHYEKTALTRAIELLSDTSLTVDKDILKDELANIIKKYSKMFLDANFKDDQ